MYKRKSFQALSNIYFWTATIHNWNQLLLNEENMIVDLLDQMSHEKLITVYGFVIMPNHIHVLWKQNKFRGNETPFAYFMKKTSQHLLNKAIQINTAKEYQVDHANKKHQIWRRDSLAIEIFSKKFAVQKLNYIHNNPTSGKWTLSPDQISYPYSSALYYDTGEDRFGFLKDLFDIFDPKHIPRIDNKSLKSVLIGETI